MCGISNFSLWIVLGVVHLSTGPKRSCCQLTGPSVKCMGGAHTVIYVFLKCVPHTTLNFYNATELFGFEVVLNHARVDVPSDKFNEKFEKFLQV